MRRIIYPLNSEGHPLCSVTVDECLLSTCDVYLLQNNLINSSYLHSGELWFAALC